MYCSSTTSLGLSLPSLLIPVQVSKAHLAKVEQERITEEQLLFDGMEPDRSSIASNMGSSHMVVSTS